MALLSDLLNKPISEIEFKINDEDKIEEISKLFNKEGNTLVKIKVQKKNKNLVFQLKNKRLVDRKSLNTLKNQDILTNII